MPWQDLHNGHIVIILPSRLMKIASESIKRNPQNVKTSQISPTSQPTVWLPHVVPSFAPLFPTWLLHRHFHRWLVHWQHPHLPWSKVTKKSRQEVTEATTEASVSVIILGCEDWKWIHTLANLTPGWKGSADNLKSCWYRKTKWLFMNPKDPKKDTQHDLLRIDSLGSHLP